MFFCFFYHYYFLCIAKYQICFNLVQGIDIKNILTIGRNFHENKNKPIVLHKYQLKNKI